MRRSMRFLRNPALRLLAAWILVGIQMEFLWLGEVHRHEDFSRPAGLAVHRNALQRSSGENSQPFCVACQIGLGRTANAAVGHFVPSVRTISQLLPTTSDQFFPGISSRVVTPRAPPTA